MRLQIVLVTALSLVSATASLQPLRAAEPARTEALPANGGDLAKAYFDLAAAMKAGDQERAGRLLDARRNLSAKQKSWFEMFAEMGRFEAAGGRRQGDRATLFLKTPGAPEYRYVSATRGPDGWRFDSPATLGSSFSPHEARSCKTSKLFPCGVASAPDARVSGTATPRRPDPDNPPAWRFVDGLAVRMTSADGKTSKGTRVLLSSHGINPDAVALSGDPDEVQGWLGWPVLSLEIAPGGKSGKLVYYDGASTRSVDVSKGLTVDATVPARVRGRLKAEVESAATVDVSFDLAAASSCVSDAYRCGPDPAP